jgi:hypothetical protein
MPVPQMPNKDTAKTGRMPVPQMPNKDTVKDH